MRQQNIRLKREKLKAERKEFKEGLKIYCRINRITFRSIADALDITEQEFHNMLFGFQEKVGDVTFDEFKNHIFMSLGVNNL